MPLNLPIDDPEKSKGQGCLYIVSTPIGNRDDITLRALKVLEQVDLIAAEDTRKTGRLLAFYKIKNRLTAYHEHNEAECTARLIQKIDNGLSIALVSNAGTPSVSDPGYRLIKEAVEGGIKIIPVPGVSAAVTALSVSGLSTDSFIFAGFLSKKKGKRLKQLEKFTSESRTMIFYESNKRIERFLGEIIETLGDRDGVLAREMTKIHEEFIRGALSEILSTIQKRTVVKGECTLIVSGCVEKEKITPDIVRGEIRRRLEVSDDSISKLSKDIAVKFGVSKKSIYDDAVKMKKKISRSD
ncbi:MAG: 16S rRNA (cytidine(1402)-2'-O)-methyltransferase [Deltaproteobacteria bacterium]|nr:16S rRNA (cytidine(1402)-2'-O)-methyltransferase [Deltaproteobacteria bacterium]